MFLTFRIYLLMTPIFANFSNRINSNYLIALFLHIYLLHVCICVITITALAAKQLVLLGKITCYFTFVMNFE